MIHTGNKAHLYYRNGRWNCAGYRAWACGETTREAYLSWRDAMDWNSTHRAYRRD